MFPQASSHSEPSPESFQQGGFAVLRGEALCLFRGAWDYQINQNSTYL